MSSSSSSSHSFLEEEAQAEAYLNEHEREIAEADHLTPQPVHVDTSKPRLSKAVRALLKKTGQKGVNAAEIMQQMAVAKEDTAVEEKTYRDEQYYISPDMPINRENDKDFLGVAQDDVAKMTASVNDALFELMPDDAQSMASKRKIVRWDNKRKRYVRGTVGELKDNTHIRNESGALIKAKSKVKRGELYDKWKSKHRVGEKGIGHDDDNGSGGAQEISHGRGRYE